MAVERHDSQTITQATICQKCKMAPANSYRPLDKLEGRQVTFTNDLGLSGSMNCQLCGEALNWSRAGTLEHQGSSRTWDDVSHPRTKKWSPTG